MKDQQQIQKKETYITVYTQGQRMKVENLRIRQGPVLRSPPIARAPRRSGKLLVVFIGTYTLIRV